MPAKKESPMRSRPPLVCLSPRTMWPPIYGRRAQVAERMLRSHITHHDVEELLRPIIRDCRPAMLDKAF